MTDSNFYEVIKYIIPLIAMIMLVYLFLENWKSQEMARQSMALKKEYKNLILPNRVQAYERMVLFLERISPNNLIPRLNDSRYSAKEFQFVLTNDISNEFEHNLSQQLYLPTKSWQLISLAKDQIIQDILQKASSLPVNATAKDLSMAILNSTISNKSNLPTKEAIELLKTDFFDLINAK